MMTGWDIGGDYDNWKTTELEPKPEQYEDEPEDFSERRCEDD